ncbi:hypothetical protein V5O48_013670 [Marasmius crinis-equi]|uniref:Uncharacterized protein n=1 Tax=Marasmius crinis-equi TaxID=585013 RepID=A0ABR3EZG7_9AGAR
MNYCHPSMFGNALEASPVWARDLLPLFATIWVIVAEELMSRGTVPRYDITFVMDKVAGYFDFKTLPEEFLRHEDTTFETVTEVERDTNVDTGTTSNESPTFTMPNARSSSLSSPAGGSDPSSPLLLGVSSPSFEGAIKTARASAILESAVVSTLPKLAVDLTTISPALTGAAVASPGLPSSSSSATQAVPRDVGHLEEVTQAPIDGTSTGEAMTTAKSTPAPPASTPRLEPVTLERPRTRSLEQAHPSTTTATTTTFGRNEPPIAALVLPFPFSPLLTVSAYVSPLPPDATPLAPRFTVTPVDAQTGEATVLGVLQLGSTSSSLKYDAPDPAELLEGKDKGRDKGKGKEPVTSVSAKGKEVESRVSVSATTRITSDSQDEDVEGVSGSSSGRTNLPSGPRAPETQTRTREGGHKEEGANVPGSAATTTTTSVKQLFFDLVNVPFRYTGTGYKHGLRFGFDSQS